MSEKLNQSQINLSITVTGQSLIRSLIVRLPKPRWYNAIPLHVGHIAITVAWCLCYLAREGTHIWHKHSCSSRQSTSKRDHCIVHQALENPMTSACAIWTQVLDTLVMNRSSGLSQISIVCVWWGEGQSCHFLVLFSGEP